MDVPVQDNGVSRMLFTLTAADFVSILTPIVVGIVAIYWRMSALNTGVLEKIDRGNTELHNRINKVKEDYVRRDDRMVADEKIESSIQLSKVELEGQLRETKAEIKSDISSLDGQLSRLRHQQRDDAMRVVAIGAKLGLPEPPIGRSDI